MDHLIYTQENGHRVNLQIVATGQVDAEGAPIFSLASVSAEAGPSTPTGLDNFEIVTGGDHVTVIAAGAMAVGGFVRNPYDATESLFVDEVNAAEVASDGGTHGSTVELLPGDVYFLSPVTTAVTANAASDGHKIVGRYS